MNARRYIVAAGLAASEVGALMVLQVVKAVATGVLSWGVAVEILLFAGVATWLWWKRSPPAAGLMLAVVGGEYWDVAMTYGRTNTWLATYLCLFLVALSIHSRKPKASPPQTETNVPV